MSKKTKVSLILLLMVAFTVSFYCNAEASFDYADLTSDEAYKIIENIEFNEIQNPNYKGKFTSFSASESGCYAIGYKKDSRGQVLVFDSDGSFINGFSFKQYGSFYIELNNEYLTVYTVRGANAITVDLSGEVISVKSILDTDQSNDYWYKFQDKKQSVGENTYNASGVLKEYTKLIRTNTNGKQVVLYEADFFGKISSALPLACIIAFPIAAILVIIVIVRKAIAK
ncbi:MAG: hypothetical protein IKL79_03745 [Clostridia bacterium]|nr:hypothetical protein [Clostridia bacterium]